MRLRLKIRMRSVPFLTVKTLPDICVRAGLCFASHMDDSSPLIRALDLIEKGQWEASHIIVQDLPSPEASWIHAHLHRMEGDSGNAAYWYSRAGKSVSELSFESEREEIRRAIESGSGD